MYLFANVTGVKLYDLEGTFVCTLVYSLVFYVYSFSFILV